MELTTRQRRILREMKEREILQDGYDDRGRDRTTDPERLEIAYELPEVTYEDAIYSWMDGKKDYPNG